MENPLTHIFLIRTLAWVQKDDKFLIAQRSIKDNYKPGEWFLPGGKLEWSLMQKPLQKNIQKELIEEVGIRVFDDMNLIDNYNFKAKKINALSITFLCKWKSGIAKALDDTENIKWLTLSQLKKEIKKKDLLYRDFLVLEAFFS